MKKTSSIIVLSLFILSAIYSQSTDRFIRIIGNADHSYVSDISRVYFTVNEIAPNEYKKISYKSIETAYSEFVEKMEGLGIDESEIVQTNAAINKYNKTKTKYYYVDINEQQKFDGLSGIQDEGFNVKEIKYLYTNIDEDLESDLSLAAIKDAKRKAKTICSEINMNLGKILNIEDISSGCCSSIEESKQSEMTKKYNITITFELLDR
jgi:uncharacterized protein YggE